MTTSLLCFVLRFTKDIALVEDCIQESYEEIINIEDIKNLMPMIKRVSTNSLQGWKKLSFQRFMREQEALNVAQDDIASFRDTRKRKMYG